jgi:hypothetical protein
METEMVEPDRTIMIVSIIGLVVIWGSFFYHKFVQGGNEGTPETDGELSVVSPVETETVAREETVPVTEPRGMKDKAERKRR